MPQGTPTVQPRTEDRVDPNAPASFMSEIEEHVEASQVAFTGYLYSGQGGLEVADDFQIDEVVEGNVPILAITGEIDLSKAPDLRARLVNIAGSGATLAVVDLTDVTFLDSTALGVLVSGLKRMRAIDGDLRLVVTRPNLVKVFEITGLLDLFPLFASRSEALA
jgi:anti-sigma B factor antagonist